MRLSAYFRNLGPWSALVAVVLCAVVAQSDGTDISCASLYSPALQSDELHLLADDASFEQISQTFMSIPASVRDEPILEIDAQRLINQDDWRKSQEVYNTDPINAYGTQTIISWLKGVQFVGKLDHPIALSADILRRIHKTVFQKLPFHGFEGRRIRALYDQRSIDKTQFQKLLREAYQNNKEVSGARHSSLLGIFRTDPIDEILHQGSSFLPDNSRYFTRQELDAIAHNKFMTLDQSSIVKLAQDIYKAKAYFCPVTKVNHAVDTALKTAQSELGFIRTLEEVVETIETMKRDLISIHPFLDGNGRTIRLLGDSLYQEYDLPPPLFPNERDLELSLNDTVDFIRNGMIANLNARIRHFYKKSRQ